MIVKCPHCETQVSLSNENPWRPFCSERCSMIDLGGWMNESNKIPAMENEFDDLEFQDSDSIRH